MASRCKITAMYSTFLREAQLIGFGYDLEQELNVRRPPQFLGFVAKPIPNLPFGDGLQCMGALRVPLKKFLVYNSFERLQTFGT